MANKSTYSTTIQLALLIVAFLVGGNSQTIQLANGEQIALSSVLSKLQAIHEDAQLLLIQNAELRARILAGSQTQSGTEHVKKAHHFDGSPSHHQLAVSHDSRQLPAPSTQSATVTTGARPALKSNNQGGSNESPIDYAELEEFNRWVDKNLEYAVRNTHATAETLKEEAQQNNGTVDYSEQAIKDGIEGVKYWQQAVIFQDKTLKNEEFESSD